MASKENHVPNRCLICYLDPCVNASSLEKQHKNSETIGQQLDVIFILRNLLEVPKENLHTYLMTWGNPQLWITTCSKCSKLIGEARTFYEEMICPLKKFKAVKKKVVRMIKGSKSKSRGAVPPTFNSAMPKLLITNETRQFVNIHHFRSRFTVLDDYGNFIDPFVMGDKRANQILQDCEWNALMGTTVEVKEEVLSDSHVEDDHDDFYNVNEVGSDGGGARIRTDKRKPVEKEQELANSSNSSTKCQLCTRYIPFEQMPKHLELHENSPHVCHFCGNVFTSDLNLTKHYMRHHKEKYMAMKKLDGGTNEITLALASKKKVVSKIKVKAKAIEVIEDSESDEINCDSTEFIEGNEDGEWIPKTESTLRQSQKKSESVLISEQDTLQSKMTEKEQELANSPSSSTKCQLCTRYIPFEQMPKHMELHENSPHVCHFCGNVFTSDLNLTKHYMRHHKEKYIAMKKLDDSQGGTEKNKVAPANKRIVSKIKVKAKAIEVLEDSESDEIDCDGTEFIDGDDDEWMPQMDSTLRRNSRNNKSTLLSEQNTLQSQMNESNKLCCPLCDIFKFYPEKRERLCDHLESCKGKDNIEHTQLVEPICPICKNCKCSMEKKSDFIEHVMICRGDTIETSGMTLNERIFTCNVCPSKKYMNFHTFLEHFLFHKKNVYKCSKCPQRYHRNIGLNAHWRVHHKDFLNVPSSHRYMTDLSVPDVPWWCSVCHEKFTEDSSRDLHLQTNHQIEVSKTYNCTKCSEGYSCEEELKLHQGTSHVTAATLYSCDVCQQHFLTPKLLRLHTRDSHQSGIFVCDFCGTEFRNQGSFKTHLQLHQEVRNYVCDECGQSFTTTQYLRNHKFREHVPPDDKINPLTCPICKKRFNNQTYRNKHIMSVHEKKYRYTCDKCGSGFLEISKLKLHLMKNHGVGQPKKHICPFEDCKKEFWQLHVFKSHVARHKNEPQYKCDYCGKEFFCNSHRRRHEKIHTNAETKPYQCEICSKSFPVRNYLYIHMRSHNKKK